MGVRALESAECEAELRAILESAPDQIYLLDMDGTIRFVNHVVAGFTKHDVIGRNWLDFVPSEYQKPWRTILSRITSGGDPERFDVLAAGPDHEISWFSSHVGPLRRDGGVVGAVVVARNITERRRTEAQLVASDRLASVGTLSAALAHEINNPLAAVLGNLELLAAMMPRDASPELAEILSDALEGARRVTQIVRDLRVFAKPTATTLVPVDVVSVLESTLRIAQNEVRHRAKLALEIEEVPHVRAIESRLGQVFLNLIVNAAQAIVDGRAQENQITIRVTRAADGFVDVAVQDTGVGIPEEVRVRLFTPFFSTKPPGEGTGLGLAISKQIISSMGGTIRVESVVGQGSTFTVSLQPAEGTRQPAQRSAPRRTAASRRGRLLIIDDEPMVLSAVVRLLSREHEVVAVQSAAEALDLLRRGERFDVVLCDVMMPHMTGVDFYEAVSAFSPEVAARVVFLTGGAFTSRAREFLERATNQKLDKPFDVATLRALVAERVG